MKSGQASGESNAEGDKTEEEGSRRMMMAYLWTFSSPHGDYCVINSPPSSHFAVHSLVVSAAAVVVKSVTTTSIALLLNVNGWPSLVDKNFLKILRHIEFCDTSMIH